MMSLEKAEAARDALNISAFYGSVARHLAIPEVATPEIQEHGEQIANTAGRTEVLSLLCSNAWGK